MSEPLGKWKQNVLLMENSLTTNSIPETSIYSMESLIDFISRYDFVYVKHDTSGQGRGVYKVYKNQDGQFCFKGYTLQGQPINKCVARIEDFHQFLHPLERFGRLSGNYIIQEGIKSITHNGKPICIRVHIQNLKGKWVIGGINGKIGMEETKDHGIINSGRSSQVISIDELLSLHYKIDDSEKQRVIDRLNKISTTVAQVIASHLPCREYGIDFGLKQNRQPVLFEVNTTPGINGFGKMENKSMWKRIVEIRKLQSES